MKEVLKRFKADLELDVPTIRARIDQANGFREKLPHIAMLIVRSIVIVAFAVSIIVGFTIPFGTDNASAGVALLLCLLTFQKVHFGYDIRHGAIALLGIFGIMAAGPPLAHLAGPNLGAVVNFIAIMLILVFGCYKVEYYNHATLVLSYLLLYGNPPANQHGAWLRVIGLAIGGIWAASLMYRRHSSERGGTLLDVMRDFNPTISANVWKIQLAGTISISMLLGHYLGMERVMWIGLAAMSVLTPFTHTRRQKMRERIIGTIIGCVLFILVLMIFHPSSTLIMGLLGGVCLGLSASYTYQSVFNTFGALGVAMALYGSEQSVWFRLWDNAFGVAFALLTVAAFDRGVSLLAKIIRRHRGEGQTQNSEPA